MRAPHAADLLLMAAVLAPATVSCGYRFECSEDSDCVRAGVPGLCSRGGGCIFPERSCESGYEWDPSSPLRPRSNACASAEDVGAGSPATEAVLEAGVGYVPSEPLPQRVGPMVVVEWTGVGAGARVSPSGFVLQRRPGERALLIAVDPTSLSPVPEPGDVVELTLLERATEPFLAPELALAEDRDREMAFTAIDDLVVTGRRVRLHEFASTPDALDVTQTLVRASGPVAGWWSQYDGGLSAIEVASNGSLSLMLLASSTEWAVLNSFGRVGPGCTVELEHGVTYPVVRFASFNQVLARKFVAVLMQPNIAVDFEDCPPSDPVGEIVITEVAAFHRTWVPYYEVYNRSERPFDLTGCALEAFEVPVGIVGFTNRVTLPAAVVPPNGFAVLAPRPGLVDDLTGWTDPRDGSIVDPVFVNIGALVGFELAQNRVGVQLSCGERVIDRIVLSSRTQTVRSIGLDDSSVDRDNLDGYRWCAQRTSFGPGIGTPGARNDPCF